MRRRALNHCLLGITQSLCVLHPQSHGLHLTVKDNVGWHPVVCVRGSWNGAWLFLSDTVSSTSHPPGSSHKTVQQYRYESGKPWAMMSYTWHWWWWPAGEFLYIFFFLFFWDYNLIPIFFPSLFSLQILLITLTAFLQIIDSFVTNWYWMHIIYVCIYIMGYICVYIYVYIPK